MDYFNYHNGSLHAEEVNLATIAQHYGTPCYVYSSATLERHWRAFDNTLAGRPHFICFAVKANSNLAVLNRLARLGSGFDVVSIGELERVLRAGGSPDKVVFSSVGKMAWEMRRALEVGIYCFNVESESELSLLNQIAGEVGKRAPIAIRVNPDVNAKTHPYISTGLKENKFGIETAAAISVYERAARLPHIEIIGIHSHIGSQLTEVEPFVDALQRTMDIVERLEVIGISLKHVDLGGGLGVRYRDEVPPEPQDYVRALNAVLGEVRHTIILEPGRAIVANAGILLTSVVYIKHTSHKHFVVIDAAMNDLIRPALYDSWHDILPVYPREGIKPQLYDVVGPVCETGDFLGKNRELAVCEGDLLAIRSTGAYGFTMSSNYNTRPRPPEVMVAGKEVHLVRKRETLEDLFRLEQIC